jgi:hypothetical protein
MDYYGAEADPTSLAWPPRPAHFYSAENVGHDREYGLAAFSDTLYETSVVPGRDDDMGLMEFATTEK